MNKRYLTLENGMVFEGEGFGADCAATGELVFTTGMTGCSETLTDPSYYGQIILFTFPQLGNYGIAHADMESPLIRARGVVCAEYCKTPSNFRCGESVDAFLKRMGVPGVSGVDTRYITQLIRERGVMNAVITSATPSQGEVGAMRVFHVHDAVETVSGVGSSLMPEGDARLKVALLDYGMKRSIGESLARRGCAVDTLPYDTSAETVLAGGYDGVMLSNGPGDPTEKPFCIEQIGALMGRLPMFGICLGHQMMALAAGAVTEKMKFGHRGANQPVRDTVSGRVFITSQNHGYAVDTESLAAAGGVPRFVNVNDRSCEGADYPGKRAFSLQFHPEAHGGPLDCEWMFDRFITMMGGRDDA